ncbi:MAG: hypothetical protein AB3N63_00670 [Puniceicoccaceae bacterium]
MVSIRHQSWFYRFLWEVGLSPLRMTELLQFLVLGWVLLSTLIGFGGFLKYGEPMVGVSVWLCVLAALHALTIVFRKNRPKILPVAFLPVPFLLYAWFNNSFISPTPWEGAPVLIACLQAYCVFLIVLNSIHGRRSQKWVLVIFQTVIGLALLSGFFQFYLYPEWMPAAERMRNPGYAHGAAGFLQDPMTLGGVILAGIPICFLMMVKHFRTRPSWMLQGFVGLALILGFGLCSHRPGLAILMVVLVSLPFLMTGRWRIRRRLWSYLFLILIGGGIMVWLGAQDLRDRFFYYFSYSGDAIASESRSIAIDQFLENILLGRGLGSFSHGWEASAAGVEGSSVYVHSAYLGLLAEVGLLGFLLAAVPILVYLGKGFSIWKSLPHLFVNKEVEGRLKKLPRGHPSRRKLERDLGKIPTPKVVAGALCLGLIALLVYQAWDYSIQLPFVLMLVAVMSAILVMNGRSSSKDAERNHLWLIIAGLPLLLAASSAWIGTPRYYASHLTYTTSEHLANAQADPDMVFDDPALTSFLEGQFELATELSPDNADAWNGIGNARLARLFAELEPAGDIAARALPAFQKASELNPGSWVAEFGLARCMAMTGAESNEVLTHLKKAVELAPNRPEPLSMLGNVLLLEDRNSQQAESYLKRAADLAFTYQPAADALEKIRLDSATASSARRRTSLVDLAYIAEQHRLIPAVPDRVTGAGLIDIKNPVKSLFAE